MMSALKGDKVLVFPKEGSVLLEKKTCKTGAVLLSSVWKSNKPHFCGEKTETIQMIMPHRGEPEGGEKY